MLTLTLTLTLLFAMLLGHDALAEVPPAQVLPRPHSETLSLINDLENGRLPDQLFAAREFKRQIRVQLRQLYSRDDLLADEARVHLDDYDRSIAPLCIAMINKASPVTAHCADILRLLETKDALPALHNALDTAEKKKTVRHLSRAIALIEKRAQEQP